MLENAEKFFELYTRDEALLKSEIHSLWVHIVGSIAIISRLWW